MIEKLVFREYNSLSEMTTDAIGGYHSNLIEKTLYKRVYSCLFLRSFLVCKIKILSMDNFYIMLEISATIVSIQKVFLIVSQTQKKLVM